MVALGGGSGERHRGFRRTAGRAAVLRVATPFDGTPSSRLRPPASYDLSVVSSGEPLRATGHASSAREQESTYQICGRVRSPFVSRRARCRFELEVTRP